MAGCELNQIFLGEIASVQNYGAFVKIPGSSQQGLVHRSQVSSAHVDNVADILQRGERVWCKVISMGDDGKVGLSMKYVNQGNGTDLDANGVQLQMDVQRKKSIVPGQRKAIQLEAVFNTTCSKCGTHGHMSNDCFMTPDGKKYELLPEVEEQKLPEVEAEVKEKKSSKKHKEKKSKKRKKSKKSKNGENDDSEEAEPMKKSKKKHSKEHKRKKRRSNSDDDTSSSNSSDHEKTAKRKRSGSSDAKAKKCKHSKTKHPDR